MITVFTADFSEYVEEIWIIEEAWFNSRWRSLVVCVWFGFWSEFKVWLFGKIQK
jgi:hypothetical protein